MCTLHVLRVFCQIVHPFVGGDKPRGGSDKLGETGVSGIGGLPGGVPKIVGDILKGRRLRTCQVT